MLPFVSTRNASAKQSDFIHAILYPQAPDNGLWTLQHLPHIDWSAYLDLGYDELCKAVFENLHIMPPQSLANSHTNSYANANTFADALTHALKLYKHFDDPTNPAPLHKLGNAYFLELYHGPTRAFKDMALSPFGAIFASVAKDQNKQFLILTATSGDTGPATLESFANQPNIKVVCLYPKGGTSEVQALQMITNPAQNIKVFGIDGNFDDAQSALKNLLNDKEFLQNLDSHNFSLSAANSVNFGRIAFQIVYHIWGYLQLVKNGSIKYGEKIYSVIPSGNFGNALGAFFAKKTGLPIEKIIIASNKNNILTEFIQSGIYDISTRTLQKTLSPAMDILKSSNVERILFALFGDVRTKELLNSLQQQSKYVLTKDELALLQQDFLAWWCDDCRTQSIIKSTFAKGYIIDPHTAIAYGAYQELCANSNNPKALIASTAEWSKFAPSVAESISDKKLNDTQAIAKMCENGAKISPAIMALFDKPIIHKQVIHSSEIKHEILRWIQSDKK